MDEIETALRDNLDRFGGLGKVVKFDCGSDGVLVIDGRAAPATISRDDAPSDCTLEIAAADLQRVLDGALDPTSAFMAGKLKVKGDMGVAMQLATLLR